MYKIPQLASAAALACCLSAAPALADVAGTEQAASSADLSVALATTELLGAAADLDTPVSASSLLSAATPSSGTMGGYYTVLGSDGGNAPGTPVVTPDSGAPAAAAIAATLAEATGLAPALLSGGAAFVGSGSLVSAADAGSAIASAGAASPSVLSDTSSEVPAEDPVPTPLPPAAALMGSALLGLLPLRRDLRKI